MVDHCDFLHFALRTVSQDEIQQHDKFGFSLRGDFHWLDFPTTVRLKCIYLHYILLGLDTGLDSLSFRLMLKFRSQVSYYLFCNTMNMATSCTVFSSLESEILIKLKLLFYISYFLLVGFKFLISPT